MLTSSNKSNLNHPLGFSVVSQMFWCCQACGCILISSQLVDLSTAWFPLSLFFLSTPDLWSPNLWKNRCVNPKMYQPFLNVFKDFESWTSTYQSHFDCFVSVLMSASNKCQHIDTLARSLHLQFQFRRFRSVRHGSETELTRVWKQSEKSGVCKDGVSGASPQITFKVRGLSRTNMLASQTNVMIRGIVQPPAYLHCTKYARKTVNNILISKSNIYISDK